MSSMAILNTKQMAEYLKITNAESNKVLDIISRSVSLAMETYCNRKFESTRITEFHDGEGDSGVLLFNNPPIVAISGIYDDPDRSFGSDTLFATSDYVIYASVGYVQLVSTSNSTLIPTDKSVFSKGVGNIKSIYTGGYATVPVDVQLAALLWAAPQYKLVDQKLHGVSTLDRGGTLQTISNMAKMPDETKELIKPYRILVKQ